MEYADSRLIGDILKQKERNIEIVGADLATRHGRADLSAFAARAAGISDLRGVIEGGSSIAN